MRKKGLLVLVLAALTAVGAFALPEVKLSAGGGGYLTGDFGGGIEASASGYTESYKIPYFGGGVFAFFDATFVELSLGLFGGGGSTEQSGTGLSSVKEDMSVIGLDIGLLGKYPFSINDKFTVFPLLGITFRAALDVEVNGYKVEDLGSTESGDFSALWFKFGGGADYSFTDAIYLRGDLLYGVRLANNYENDGVDTYKNIPGVDAKTLLGHGLEIKIAVGYRF